MLELARQKPEKHPWLTQLLARKPFKIVAVALANKMARIAWALLVKGGPYRALHWWQRPKGTGDGRMRLRMSVHELQG